MLSSQLAALERTHRGEAIEGKCQTEQIGSYAVAIGVFNAHASPAEAGRRGQIGAADVKPLRRF